MLVTTPLGNTVTLSLIPNVRIDIAGKHLAKFCVRFIDRRTGECVYEPVMGLGDWAEPNPKYFVDWHITVEEGGVNVIDYKHDLEGKRVLILIDSAALGDTIAWFPCIDQFQRKHKCLVTACTYWNAIFQANYPNLEFVEPEGASLKGDWDASYRIGCYDNDYNKNKQNWRAVPLQQVASDTLGLDYELEKPRIVESNLTPNVDGHYVAISEFAAGYMAKRWLFPGGWQQVVDHLSGLGYKVVSVSKERSALRGVIRRNGLPIAQTIRNIQHAEFFIGVSSGPTWLAWALGVPTICVSGFSEEWAEVPDMIRVLDESRCHGCFNDFKAPLDRNNVHYCPRGKNLVCTLGITPDMIFKAIHQARAKRVLFVIPHCSTGGGPQYWLWQARKLVSDGFVVGMVEWRNISDTYTVQRDQLQALLGDRFFQVNGDATRLLRTISDFNPDMIHFQEPPEWMFDAPTASAIYAPDRTYRIIQTLHTSEFGPKETRYWPDAFCFVSQFHASLFHDECCKRGIQWTIDEYTLPRRDRPDRKQALESLGLDPNKRHVLNVGLFTPGKNQGVLFEAARNLPNVQFHFVGNAADNFRPYWGPLISDKPDNVRLWGEQHNVDQFYMAMDLFVFTSMRELNPLVIKEALAWNMPVLMRNLQTYCEAYDRNPQVRYIAEGHLAAQIEGLLK